MAGYRKRRTAAGSKERLERCGGEQWSRQYRKLE
jgi:hypothetical protein